MSETIELQANEVAEQLGTPDFSDFASDDNASPDITEAIMSEEGPQSSVAVGAGDMTVVFVKFMTSFMASRKGEHWNLTKDEAVELKNAMDAVAPDMHMSPAWTLAAVAAGITVPRLLLDIQIQQKLEEKEVDKGGENDTQKATP